MEIYMHNINYSATDNQVHSSIASILHGPRYENFSSALLNFHVRLFKDKRGSRRHSGTGALTLPTPEVGIQFLKEYGEAFPLHTCVVAGRRIRFAKSNHTALPDVIESIRRRPYIDHRAMEEKEKRDAILNSAKVSIKTVQFGWYCRDSVFSIEWEQSFEACFLFFDDDRRDLRVKFKNNDVTFVIAVLFTQIRYTSAHLYLSEEPIILLSLTFPPAFELEPITEGLRQRLPALPFNDHARVAPYTSLDMRLICSSLEELYKFRDLYKVAHLHNIDNSDCMVARRDLFSATAINELQQNLRNFNWCISFQLESLIRSLLVDVKEILDLIIPRIKIITQEKGKLYTSQLLRRFHTRVAYFNSVPDDMEERNIEECFSLSVKDFASLRFPISQSIDENLFNVFHVIVTPTTMFLDGPFPERSNRVVRRYDSIHHESFLRVSFLEETHLQYRFDREVDGPAFIRSRVGDLLLNGLTIARRTFRFLAYSQSALKEHTVWFVKPFRDNQHGYVDARTIIQSLGAFKDLDFDPQLVYCPARYAARLSQAFTATDISVTMEVEEIFYGDDINTKPSKYCFTDGVGTMSRELAIEISKSLRSRNRRTRRTPEYPRAIQVRFMGSKGMLSVDYTLRGRAICLRPSMIKFNAPESRNIEIARAFDRPGAYFLNRPLIMLLEGLGVKYEVFKDFQDRSIQETQNSTKSLTQAARMLENHGLGTSYRLTSVMLSLARLGIEELYDNQFHQRVLEIAVHHVLRVLKNHARIPIPGAWTLVGVADIHKFLKEGEIFACIKPIEGGVIYLEGPVLISRSPTIHPGDVQIVRAIGVPPLGSCFSEESLPNTVVFSVLGTRPLPSCLGGGDLDGDIYNLIPLNKLPGFRPTQYHPPAEYSPAQKKMLDHPSTMEDIAEFVMEYINSDVVGIIAINWLILADQYQEKGIFHPDCLKLSALHSDAVDYPKSGNPVALSSIPKLRFREKPDWSAPETIGTDSARFYESQRAIGRLFRDIDLPAVPKSVRIKTRRFSTGRTANELAYQFANFNLDDVDETSNMQIIKNRVSRFIDIEENIEEEFTNVQLLFHYYVSELHTICTNNTLSQTKSTPLTEEEAVIGTITQKSSQQRKRKDATSKLREQTDILVKEVREELMGNHDMSFEELLKKAWLAWVLSMIERESFGGKSFGLIALGGIFEVIKEIEDGL